MNDNNFRPDGSIFADFTWWVKKYSKSVEEYFEEHTISHIIFRTLTIIFTTVLGFAKIFDVFGGNLDTNIVILILIILISLFIVLDFSHVILSYRRRKAILIRDDEIAVRNRIIREVAEHLLHYRVNKLKIIRSISENGDVDVERSTLLQPISSFIPIIFVDVWLVDVNKEVAPKALNLIAMNISSATPYRLRDILIEDRSTAKKFAIVLSPPVFKDETTHVQVTYKWHGAWKSLFEKGSDSGEINIINDTDEYELQYKLPPGWHFTHVGIAPRPDVYNSEMNSHDGNNIVIIKLFNLKAGQHFRCTLYAEKNNHP